MNNPAIGYILHENLGGTPKRLFLNSVPRVGDIVYFKEVFYIVKGVAHYTCEDGNPLYDVVLSLQATS